MRKIKTDEERRRDELELARMSEEELNECIDILMRSERTCRLFLSKCSVTERLQGLTVEQRLTGLSVQQIFQALSPEERAFVKRILEEQKTKSETEKPNP